MDMQYILSFDPLICAYKQKKKGICPMANAFLVNNIVFVATGLSTYL